VRLFSVHYEACTQLANRTLQAIKAEGMKRVLRFNPHYNIAFLEDTDQCY